MLAVIAACLSVGANSVAPATGQAILFEQNQGQWDKRVEFRARTAGLSLWMTSSGVTYELRKVLGKTPKSGAQAHAVRVDYVGSNPRALAGEERAKALSHYLIGIESSGWIRNVPNFKRAVFKEIYPGIDLVWMGSQGKLRYDFVVKPGADPAAIRLRYSGVKDLAVQNGALSYKTSLGPVSEGNLRAFQMEADRQTPVKSGFKVTGNEVQIALGHYDRSKPLIIDPTIYSTLLGAEGSDSVSGITVRGGGAATVCGWTDSSKFPTTVGAFMLDGPTADAFVTQMLPDGSGPAFSTYLGGGGVDQAFDIESSLNGQFYVALTTDSTDMPLVRGMGYQTHSGGGPDGYVVKMSAAGDALLAATYFGGSGDDIFNGLAVNDSGLVALSGSTSSTNVPRSWDALQKKLTGTSGLDGLMVVLSDDLADLVFGSYFGGDGIDEFADVGTSTYGTFRWGGYTTSSATSLPSGNWISKTRSGSSDALLVDVAVYGGSSAWQYFGCLFGGSGEDMINSVAFDHVAGVTSSPTLLGTAEAPYPNSSGPQDGFIALIRWGTIKSTFAGIPAPYDREVHRFGEYDVNAEGLVISQNSTWIGLGVSSNGQFYDETTSTDTFAGRSEIVRFDADLTESIGRDTVHVFADPFNRRTRITALSVDGFDTLYAGGDTEDSAYPGSAEAFLDTDDMGIWLDGQTHGFVQAIGRAKLRTIRIPSWRMLSGTSAEGTIVLSAPAPVQGALVHLSSGAAELVVPDTVAIPAGLRTATFQLSVAKVAKTADVEMAAEYLGEAITSRIRLRQPYVSSLNSNSLSIGGGVPLTLTIAIDGAIAPSGCVVKLTSSDPSSIFLPETIIVPEGSTQHSLSVTPSLTATDKTVTLSARTGGQTRQCTIDVRAPQLKSLIATPAKVKGGSATAVYLDITLTSPALPNTTIQLSSSSTQIEFESTSVSVPGGATTTRVKLKKTLAVSQAVTVLIRATLGSSQCSGSLILVPSL